MLWKSSGWTNLWKQRYLKKTIWKSSGDTSSRVSSTTSDAWDILPSVASDGCIALLMSVWLQRRICAEDNWGAEFLFKWICQASWKGKKALIPTMLRKASFLKEKKKSIWRLLWNAVLHYEHIYQFSLVPLGNERLKTGHLDFKNEPLFRFRETNSQVK